MGIFRRKRNEDEIQQYADEARRLIEELGYDVSGVRREIEVKKMNALGRCSKIVCRGCSGTRDKEYDYWIAVTDDFLYRDVPADWIMAVMLHEYIHALPGCFAHTDKFRGMCDVIRRKYGYDPAPGIFRKTIRFADRPGVKAFCPKCGQGLEIRGETMIRKLRTERLELVCDLCECRFVLDDARSEDIGPYIDHIFKGENI